MKNTIDTRAMIAHLQRKLNRVKRIENHGLSEKLLDAAVDDMISCKEVIEALIGEQVNCQKDGRVTLGMHGEIDPLDVPEWKKKESELYGNNGPIIARDSDTGEVLGAFATYWDFRERWPGAEIVRDDKLEPGMGHIIYC